MFFQVRSKLVGELAFRKKSLFSGKFVECASCAIPWTSATCMPYPSAIHWNACACRAGSCSRSIPLKIPATSPLITSGWSLAKSARAAQTSAISLFASEVVVRMRVPGTFSGML